MNASLATLTLVRPRTLDEALNALAAEPSLVPIAGCTDVYVALHFRTLPARRFIDLWALDELRGVSRENGVLRLGALTTYSDMRRSTDVVEHLPMLTAAAGEIGGVQIQNRGTIGGNIANGSPAGDSLPVLAVADAVLVLRDAAGERRVPFNDFFTGYRASVLRPGELIVAVEVPPVHGTQWFRKVGTRAAQAISKVVVAGIRGGNAREARLAVGSVAPTVVRLGAVEAALAEGATDDEAVAVLEGEIQPIDDIRSTAEYRRAVTANLLRRFLADTAA